MGKFTKTSVNLGRGTTQTSGGFPDRVAKLAHNAAAKTQKDKIGFLRKLAGKREPMTPQQRKQRIADLQYQYQQESLQTKIAKTKAARPSKLASIGLGSAGMGLPKQPPADYTAMDSMFGSGSAKATRAKMPKAPKQQWSGMDSLFGNG